MKDNPDVDTAVSYKHIKYQLKHHRQHNNDKIWLFFVDFKVCTVHYLRYPFLLFLHYILEYKVIRVGYLQFFYLKFRFFLNKMPYSKISKVAYM
jgi:hypothetical protein